MISKQELLQHWLGHRALTAKTIAAFPEDALFNFSVGGMRTFAQMIAELLALSGEGLQELATGEQKPFNEAVPATEKQALLDLWNKNTAAITSMVDKIHETDIHRSVKLFGQYEFSVQNHLLYFIDNEVHHRAQAFVYLRALGVEPPPFWLRD